VRGIGNKEIADELGIAEATVKVYLVRIFKKFRVSSRLEAALFWMRNFVYE
jgi:DNA-binding NarL/FixJ family response regulator